MREKLWLFVALGGLAATSALLSAVPAQAQNVLVFDENSTHGRARDACTRLGLTCTRALAADFTTRIAGSTWDLVVLDMPSSEPDGAWQSALVAYVTGGGRAIHSQWNDGSLAGIPVAFQATVGGSHDGIPFYRWSSSTLFASPESVPASFTVIMDVWGTNGFYLTPVAPAYAAAGFTMTPTTGQAAIVVGNSDRTIFNGFLYDDFTGDADADMIPDITELLMNEISFLVGGASPTAPCVGLAEGASCTTAAGAMGRCRSGGCCVGCWNGTRCQLGTAAAFCGTMGRTCTSCVDTDTCTSDVCTAGVCSNPDAPTGTSCNDSLYCTATDSCDGSGTCMGAGTPCDDGMSCTIDTCTESTDSCVFTPDSGCTIGGECVGTGVGHPSYPCLVCDPPRDMTDWSARAVGTTCGVDRCAAGVLTPASTCNATGTCAPSPSMPCASGVCEPSGLACTSTCADTGCPAGEYCASVGTCMPVRPDGEGCASAMECASGQCVDAVCCGDVCDGTCERCDLAPAIGTCSRVPTGMDPDEECATACDGAGACLGVDGGGVPVADGGVEEDASLPTPDASVADAGRARPSSRGGCGCRAAEPRSSDGWALALLVLWLARRRSKMTRRRKSVPVR